MLYKNIDDIEKPKPSEEDKQTISFFDKFHSPVMFGDLGNDIYNYFSKNKNGHDGVEKLRQSN